MDQPIPVTPPNKPEQSPQTTPQPKKNGGFFAFLGKVFIFLIIIGLLVGGGYYLGATNKPNPNPTPTPTPGYGLMGSPTQVPISPTAASQNTKTVKAGLATSPYSIDVPQGWTDARENTQEGVIDKLTLSKNGYTLTIYQAAMGGGGCLYDGAQQTEMTQTFTNYVDINAKSGQYRRSWNEPGTAQTISYTICKKGTDNSYGIFSAFGVMNAVSPNPADAKIMAEVDGMIASLAKQ